MYEIGDIVLVKSSAGAAIPPVHVKLIQKLEVKGRKGNSMEWPSFIGWECVLTKPEEANLLRKKWGIPFKPPHDMQTFTYERDIIKKISSNIPSTRRHKRAKSKPRTN